MKKQDWQETLAQEEGVLNARAYGSNIVHIRVSKDNFDFRVLCGKTLKTGNTKFPFSATWGDRHKRCRKCRQRYQNRIV